MRLSQTTLSEISVAGFQTDGNQGMQLCSNREHGCYYGPEPSEPAMTLVRGSGELEGSVGVRMYSRYTVSAGVSSHGKGTV